jgi:alpha-1,2-glucosyltransferase
VNVVFSAATLLILYLFLKDHATTTNSQRSSAQGGSSSHTLLHALVLALYPIHWFYSFLYYTDVGSTAVVLLCLLLARKHLFLAAAAVGMLALTLRQTNAIWATFILGSQMVDVATTKRGPLTTDPSAGGSTSCTTAPQYGLLPELRALWENKASLFFEMWPLLSVPIAFAVFVKVNRR